MGDKTIYEKTALKWNFRKLVCVTWNKEAQDKIQWPVFAVLQNFRFHKGELHEWPKKHHIFRENSASGNLVGWFKIQHMIIYDFLDLFPAVSI